MKSERVSALLGRPLTSTESSNFDLYLKIANQSLEDMLCTSLCDQDDPKIYDIRIGYSTVFTDIFTDVDEVKVDGEVIPSDEYSIRQWDKRNGSWYNSIVFDKRFTKYDEEVEVSATWGFETLPRDLQAVLAGLFDLVTKKSKLDALIAEKRVEDFSIRFRPEADLDIEFYRKYARTISKYAQCDIPYIRHGTIRHDNDIRYV